MKALKEKQSLVEEMCSPLVSLKEGNYKAGIMQFLSKATFHHELMYSWLKGAPQWLYTWRLAHLDYKEIPQGLFTKQSLIKNATGNADYFVFILKGHLFFFFSWAFFLNISIDYQLKAQLGKPRAFQNLYGTVTSQS